MQSFEGKEAAELIQGVWIIEVGEMTGYNRSETSAVKQFLSKTADRYRQAYGRYAGEYPRRCVFFGTCNPRAFLKDLTGNRRLWPIDIDAGKPTKSIFNDLPKEVDQLWAEAVGRYRLGEKLYLDDPEVARIALDVQEQHKESNAKEGVIQGFLEKPVPVNYGRMSLSERRMYWSGAAQDVVTVPREKVCAMEVWCECFGGDIKNLKQSETKDINQIIENTKGWQRNKSQRRYGYCGKQRGFDFIV